jgi:hypothetical protein
LSVRLLEQVVGATQKTHSLHLLDVPQMRCDAAAQRPSGRALEVAQPAQRRQAVAQVADGQRVDRLSEAPTSPAVERVSLLRQNGFGRGLEGINHASVRGKVGI